MALHRDIHWIGRQWAVTGFGMQLIDQKLKGFFDIEASRLFEDGLAEAMHAKDWLNKADFDKGLEIARKRVSEPQGNVARPPEEKVFPAPANGHIAPLPQAPKPEAPKLQKPEPIAAVPKATEPAKPMRLKITPIAPAKPAPSNFHVQFTGSAKFVKPWRVMQKR